MNRLLAGLLGVGLAIGSGGPAWGVVLHDNGEPDLIGYFLVNEFYPDLEVGGESSDDFTLGTLSVIRNVQWWGLYGYFDTPGPDHFTIRVFEFVDGTPEKTPLYEMPPDAIAPPTRTDTGHDIEGWGPNGQSDSDLYLYCAQLPDIPLRAGRHLISIVNDTRDDRDDDWYWISGDDGNGESWARNVDGAAWRQSHSDWAFNLAGLNVPRNPRSVAPGLWSSPAIWDCNCVPAALDGVQVGHNVTVAAERCVSSLLVFYGQVTVAPGATLGAIRGVPFPLAELTLSNGTLTVQGGGGVLSTNAELARLTGSLGTATVVGTDAQGNPATWTNDGYLDVGVRGTGVLDILNGGVVAAGQGGLIGIYETSHGTVTVNGAGSTFRARGEFRVGSAGRGVLDVLNGGTADCRRGIIAWKTNSQGTVTVDGAASNWNVSDYLLVGGGISVAGGTGKLTIKNGGLVKVAGTTEVSHTGTLELPSTQGPLQGGLHTGSLIIEPGGTLTHEKGILTVDGGTLDLGTAAHVIDGMEPTVKLINGATGSLSGPLTVGLHGMGLLEISRGSRLSSGAGNLGPNSHCWGVVTVDGTDSADNPSTWTVAGSLHIAGDSSGPGGSGVLTVKNGGLVEVGGTTRLWEPAGNWDDGTVEILGGELKTGSFIADADATFSHEDGTLIVDGGTLQLPLPFHSPGCLIDGAKSGDFPTVRLINGATAPSSNSITVGKSHSGRLEVRTGSQFASSSGTLGNNSGSTGLAIVDGAGSTWTISGLLCVGYYGTGGLDVSTGGSVSSADGVMAGKPGSSSIVTVDGKDNSDNPSTWTVDGRLDVAGFYTSAGGTGRLTVKNGATVDVADSLRIWGPGTVNLEGGMLKAGSVDHRWGGTFNFTGGRLSVGTFQGHLLDQGGAIAPGPATALTTINGNLTVNAGAVEIEIGGPAPGTGYDQLRVNGAVNLGAAAELNLSLGYAPSRGDTFLILNNDLADPVGGQFAGLPDDSRFVLDGHHFGIDYHGVDGNDVTLTYLVPEVTGRYVFYNNSAFDDPERGLSDNHAIAPDPEGASDPGLGKTALLSGQTATFQNLTSYDKGINGITIDMEDLYGTLPEGAFDFKVGNDDHPAGWIDAPEPLSITLLPGEGTEESDRLVIIWEDGAILNQWLQVTIDAEAMGLTADDVFYFGNAAGESGDSAAAHVIVNTTDEILARQNIHGPRHPTGIDSRFDYDRDGLVNVNDRIIARKNRTGPEGGLRWITVPGPGGALAATAAVVPEPTTAAMLATVVLGLLLLRWRRHRMV